MIPIISPEMNPDNKSVQSYFSAFNQMNNRNNNQEENHSQD